MRAIIRTLFLLLAIGGCVRLDQEYPQRQSFDLAVTRPETAVAAPGPGEVQVRRIEVSQSFSSPNFVYRTGELTYESDFYNRFLSSPSTLLTEQIRRWLAAAGLLAGSVAGAAWGPADYMLVGEVPAIYGDFRDRPQAVLEIEFALLDFRTADPRKLWTKRYRQEVLLPAKSPQGLVQGWNEALARILTDLETDLRKVLGAKASAPGME